MTYYEILNVSTSASSHEILVAFKKLAKQYHPDKNKDPEATTKFIQIYEAYKILNNPETKAKYDKLLHNKEIITQDTQFNDFVKNAKNEGKTFASTTYYKTMIKILKKVKNGFIETGLFIIYLFLTTLTEVILPLLIRGIIYLIIVAIVFGFTFIILKFLK